MAWGLLAWVRPSVEQLADVVQNSNLNDQLAALFFGVVSLLHRELRAEYLVRPSDLENVCIGVDLPYRDHLAASQFVQLRYQREPHTSSLFR